MSYQKTGSILVDDEHYSDYHMKSHSLIYASSDLTARMMDIFALMLTEMKHSDWDSNEPPTYSFSSKQLCEWFDCPKKQLYSRLKEPAKQLASKTLGIEQNGKFRYTPILSSVSYENGTLTIKPNNELKSTYIVNLSQNGFAKVDNKIFRSLINPNEKKIFEFLCRYRYDKEMYFITLKKLQIIFGIKSEDGRVLKETYKSPTQFVSRLIAPALKKISQSDVALEKMILIEKNGKVGYELVDCEDGINQKIRFLVKWKNEVTKEELNEAAGKAVQLSSDLANAKKNGTDTYDILVELLPILDMLGYSEKAEAVSQKVAEIEKERRDQELKIKEEKESKQTKRLEELIQAGFLDDL